VTALTQHSWQQKKSSFCLLRQSFMEWLNLAGIGGKKSSGGVNLVWEILIIKVVCCHLGEVSRFLVKRA
jgi:hypothetical protein